MVETPSIESQSIRLQSALLNDYANSILRLGTPTFDEVQPLTEGLGMRLLSETEYQELLEFKREAPLVLKYRNMLKRIKDIISSLEDNTRKFKLIRDIFSENRETV